MLFTKKCIVSIFLTTFIVFCTSISSYANTAPTFTDGNSPTRTIAENTASGVNIGNPISATDADGDTLRYTLGGTDASSFSIVSTTGQLRTNAALNHEADDTYTVTVSVTDNNGGSDSITVTINVTDVNERPIFSTSGRVTLSVTENTASGTNIGDAFQATDPDSGDTVTYSLQRGDRNAFRIDATTGQLRTHAALDYETKRAYSDLAVRATDSAGLSNSVLLTINVKSASKICRVGDVLAAGESCTYPGTQTELSINNNGNAQFLHYSGGSRLNIDSEINNVSYTLVAEKLNSGDWEIKELGATESPQPSPNNAPEFTDGTSTTRSVAENTPSGANIGSTIAATEADDHTLTYTLSGTDAASFTIVSTTGQLQTSTPLDYETKPSYAVTVSVDDGNDGSDSIDVTINVTDVDENVNVRNNPPKFDNRSATRSIAENTAANTPIGGASLRLI